MLKKIRKLSKNNTVVLVEHEQYFIDAADHKIHIGKNAGKNGGYKLTKITNDAKRFF